MGRQKAGGRRNVPDYSEKGHIFGKLVDENSQY
jgi:hypothetical protein